jgi:hypothetical protein
MNGIQVVGFTNFTDGLNGIQIAGFANTTSLDADANGVQIAGVSNLARVTNGIQVAGIGNIATEVRGVQIAGVGNVADEMQGVQIGGFNVATTLRSLQIGLISINDTIASGASLSLVNIVRQGFYREWQLSFSDYANIALSYKMGTQRFYTLYTIGANFIEDNLWLAGIGFGNRTPISNRIDFQPELVFYNYFPSNFRNIQHTSTTRLRLGFVYNINEKLGLSFAPSVYMKNARKNSNNPDAAFYNISPFSPFRTSERGNRLRTIGGGVSLGLSIR